MCGQLNLNDDQNPHNSHGPLDGNKVGEMSGKDGWYHPIVLQPERVYLTISRSWKKTKCALVPQTYNYAKILAIMEIWIINHDKGGGLAHVNFGSTGWLLDDS